MFSLKTFAYEKKRTTFAGTQHYKRLLAYENKDSINGGLQVCERTNSSVPAESVPNGISEYLPKTSL